MTNQPRDVHGPADECEGIARETERAGDRYYDAMTKWLTKRRRRPEETKKLVWLGRTYDRGLGLLIDCLERIRNRHERFARKRNNAAKLQSYLHNDLEYIENAQADEA